MAQVLAAATSAGDTHTSQMLESWASADQNARILMDRSLHIKWANGAAEALFAERIDVELRHGHVQVIDADQHARLKTFVAASETRDSSLVLRSCTSHAHLMIRMNKVPSATDDHIVGLSLLYPKPPAFADMDEAFVLTPAEGKVLRHMLQGRVAEEIAEASAISLNTVRSHIRSIYAKMGVRSRETFFQRASSYILY